MKKRIVLTLVIVSVVATGIFATSMRNNRSQSNRVSLSNHSSPLYVMIDEDTYKNVETNVLYSKSDLSEDCKYGENERALNGDFSKRDKGDFRHSSKNSQTNRNNTMRDERPTFARNN